MPSSANSEERPTFLLLGAGFETRNLGVSALACGALTGILRTDSTARVIIGDYSRTEKRYSVRVDANAHEVPLLAFRFSWRVWLPNNIFRLLAVAAVLRVLPAPLRRRWISRNRVLSMLSALRTAFAVNGGDSFSDIYGLRRLVYVILPQLLILQLGRPLVLLPQTYGPFRGFWARRLAATVLRRASMIWTRDHESSSEIEKLTQGERQAEATHDMAFLMPPTEPPNDVVVKVQTLRASNHPLVGLNVSGLLWIGGYTRDNSFGLRCGYRRLVEEVVMHLVTKRNCRILLIPHVLGDHEESDLLASRAFLDRVPSELHERITFLDTRWNQHEVKWVIGQCDFFVGSRMHACIAAMSQAVPAVGLAYSDKFHGVFKTVGAENLAVDLRTKGVRDVVACVDAAFNERNELREQLAQQVPRASATVSNLFERVIAPGAGGAVPDSPSAKVPSLARL